MMVCVNSLVVRNFFRVIPFILGLTIYAKTIDFGFVWDDHQFFEDSSFFAKASIGKLFLSPIPLWENDIFYRPLTQTLFYYQYILGGGDPSVFHIVNLLIFLINAQLVMGIVARAKALDLVDGGSNKAGFVVLLSGILYVVHPAMAEVVSWVSSQFDLQMTFWLLLLFFLSMLKKSAWISLAGSMVCYFFACSSKELSVFFPLVFIAQHYFIFCINKRENSGLLVLLKERLPDLVGMMMGGCVYLAFRMHCLGGNPLNIFRVSASDLYLEAVRSLCWYFKLSIMPFYGMGMHFKDGHEYSSFWYAIGGSAILMATLLSLRFYMALGLIGLCFIIALAPALLTVTAGYSVTFVSDRYLSYPLSFLIIQLCLLAGCARWKFSCEGFLPRFLWGVIFFLVFEMAFYSFQLAKNWSSDLAIWAQTLEVNPNVQYARSQVVATYAEMGLCEKAEQIAAKKTDTTVTAMIAVARCHLEKSPEFSLKQMESLLGANGALGEHDFYNVLTTMAIANTNLGNYDKAVEIYRDVLSAYPERYKIHWSLSQVFLRACREDESRKEFDAGYIFVPQAAKSEWTQLYAKSVEEAALVCNQKDSFHR